MLYRWTLAIVTFALIMSAAQIDGGGTQVPATSTGKSPAAPAPLPMYSTIILKPGESQLLSFSAPGWAIGSRDRTMYTFEAVNDAGEKVAGLRGVAGQSEWHRAGEISDKCGVRLAAIRVSAKEDTETGKALYRLRGQRFGQGQNYEIMVRVIVAK